MKILSWVVVLSFLFPVGVRLAAAPEPLMMNGAQSHVEIVVKATFDSFVGKIDVYKAAITVEGGRIATAALRFNFNAIHTGKGSRDEAMNEWQETVRYPEVGFILAALEPAAEGHFTARGVLALHGVSREILFPVAVITDRKIYAIDGEARIDTRDFGLPVIRKFGLLKVDPIVTVRFHLQGATAARG